MHKIPLPSAWFEKWTPKTRGLLLLAVLSVVCGYFALAGGRGLFGTVFFALSVTAVLGATHAPIGWNPGALRLLEDGVVVGRIFLMPIGLRGRPWMWASGHNGAIERAAHGYEPTCEAALAAFAKSWRRPMRPLGAYLSGKLSGLMFQTILSVGRSGRI